MPIEIKDGIHTDGRNRFIVKQSNKEEFVLAMSHESNFVDKYRFNLTEVSVDKFNDICLEKQTSPSSYFVKNIICTKPTRSGRITLLNDKLIEKKGKERTEKLILDQHELTIALRNNFDVMIR
jgi:N-hydroxyarylamine O-acetyltransferase